MSFKHVAINLLVYACYAVSTIRTHHYRHFVMHKLTFCGPCVSGRTSGRWSTFRSISPSKSITPTIPSSLVQCTSRKGIPRQVNYLIGEASDTGKGANTVISLLHHFLGHHALGEVELKLHSDNCFGQNKNNMVL